MPEQEAQTRPRDPALQFFGRVTAGATHELNNVLSIIEQMTGLIEDQVAMSSEGYPLDAERLASVLPRIERQIDRGADLLRNLNQYAHTVDHTSSSVDANDLLEILHALTARFANLASISVRVEPAPDHVLIETDTFALLHALFELSLAVIAQAEKRDDVIMGVESGEDQVAFSFRGAPVDRLVTQTEHHDSLRALADAVGGTVAIPEGAIESAAIELFMSARVIAGLT